MKKLTAISILLVLLSTAAFAQLKVGFTSNLWTDAVFFEKATGDMADADSVKGASNIFSSSRLNANQLRLQFTYTGENFGGFLIFRGDELVTRNGGNAQGGTDNRGPAAPSDASFFGSGAGLNFQSFLDRQIEEFQVYGNAFVFKGWVGNGVQRGKVGSYRFADAGDFVSNGLSNYGVVKANMGIANGKSFAGMVGTGSTDTDNLRYGSRPSRDISYVSLGIDLSSLSVPILIEVASNALFSGFENRMGLSSTVSGTNVAATSADSIAAVFRVSGGKIADFISFDAVYRINGTDANTRQDYNNGVVDPLVGGSPLSGGWWENELGVYVGLDIIKGLQLGAGYTAAFRVDEQTRVDASPDGATIEKVNPLYSGIDLHVKFTGVDKLGITLNNNLSFAFQRGENRVTDGLNPTGGRVITPLGYNLPAWGEITDVSPYRVGVDGLSSFQTYYDGDGTDDYHLEGGNMWNTDMKDSWFALWNTLAVTYAITPKATARVAISNRLSVYDFVAKPEDEFAKWTTDDFQVGLSGEYTFNSNIRFAAGLNVRMWGMTADITTTNNGTTAPTLSTGKIGEVRLAIPIQFRVQW